MLSEMIFYFHDFHGGREDRKHDELKNITCKKINGPLLKKMTIRATEPGRNVVVTPQEFIFHMENMIKGQRGI